MIKNIEEKELNKNIEAIKKAIENIQDLGFKITFSDLETDYGYEGFAVMHNSIKHTIYYPEDREKGYFFQTFDKEVRFDTSKE